MTAQVKKLMQTLNISEAEALEILAEDKEIDRGAKLYELPEDRKAGAKKARRAERKQTEPVKRERKVDPDKLALIQTLDDALCDIADNVEERKNETDIHFTYNGNKYSVKLIKHRPAKSE